MNLTNLAIGGDIDLTVVLPLPLTDYKNIAVWLVDSKCKVFGKYSLYSIEGHNSDDVHSTGANEIHINVQKSVTKEAAEGVCSIEIYEGINDVGLEDNYFGEVSSSCPLCYLYKTKIASLSL